MISSMLIILIEISHYESKILELVYVNNGADIGADGKKTHRTVIWAIWIHEKPRLELKHDYQLFLCQIENLFH